MTAFYEKLVKDLVRHGALVVASVIQTSGSTPRAEGAKMIVYPDGSFSDTVGGGVFESLVIQDALLVYETRKSVVKRYSFNESGTDAIGAVCGGIAEVYLELVEKRPELIIVGGGHVGRALARVAALLEFDIVVVDDREAFVNPADYSSGVRVRHSKPDYSDLPPVTENSYVALVSKGYPSDEAALRHVIRSSARYIGMIGSRKKIKTVFGNLKNDGFDEKLFDRVHAPIGIDVGSDTPEEIAISILAEIIRIKNSGTGEK